MTARTYHLTPPTGPVMRAVCGQKIGSNYADLFVEMSADDDATHTACWARADEVVA